MLMLSACADQACWDAALHGIKSWTSLTDELEGALNDTTRRIEALTIAQEECLWCRVRVSRWVATELTCSSDDAVCRCHASSCSTITTSGSATATGDAAGSGSWQTGTARYGTKWTTLEKSSHHLAV